MAYGVVLRFGEVTEDQYWSVNRDMGVDEDGLTGWPEGLISHTAAFAEGGFVISEVWASRDDQERFMAERLAGALAANEVGSPREVLELEVINYQHPG